MATKIRMSRAGAKNRPFFKIVVADSRSPRDGKCTEELGTYLPEQKGTNYTLDLARTEHWLARGAQPSETVATFIMVVRCGKSKRVRLATRPVSTSFLVVPPTIGVKTSVLSPKIP